MAYFDRQVFGDKLEDEEMEHFLQGEYGTLRNVSNKQQEFQVYQAGPTGKQQVGVDYQKLSQIMGTNLLQQQLSSLNEPLMGASGSQNESAARSQFSVVKQLQVVTQNGKKKIIPTMKPKPTPQEGSAANPQQPTQSTAAEQKTDQAARPSEQLDAASKVLLKPLPQQEGSDKMQEEAQPPKTAPQNDSTQNIGAGTGESSALSNRKQVIPVQSQKSQ